jgi:pimeloyl-ACP methyl ester carboxylesterase
METVRTHVGKVAVQRRGEGPPLVLLHSVAHDHRDYDLIAPTLAQRFHTVAVDWPGHGASDMWSAPGSASAEQLFDVLEEVVSGLGLSPAIFMGNSVGGAASLRLAARRPDQVKALVLVDSGGSAVPSPLVSAFCWVQGRERVRRWTGMQFARAYLKTPGAGRDALLARLAEQRERPGFIEMDAAIWRSFSAPANDLSPVARSVRAPTLIVWGKHDPVVRAHVEGKRMRQLLPHADYVELATGHTPFVERPAAFLEAVAPFLEAVRADSRSGVAAG